MLAVDARRHASRRRDEGQVLVLFALSVVVIFGFAGLAFDIGRFYTERRFLQNAADAAALAAGNALVQGATTTEAEAVARDVLTHNFVGDPTGVTPSLPPATPVYETGHSGDPAYLVDGVVITNSEIRVAVRNPVGYTFGRAVGLDRTTVGARARITWNGSALPIAVRQFVGVPGPNAGATSPCPDDQNQFNDFFATADTTCLGTDTDAALRTDPSPGDDFNATTPGDDPEHHGPIVAILGQGAQPSNGVDFRGFIALDIRNFATTTSQIYYAPVTSSTNPNTLKDLEATYACTGYTGIGFPPPTSPPDPNDQVAIMSGNSTGIVIDEVNRCHWPGEEILVMVYPGTVMAIPDFAISPPTKITLPVTGTTANPGSFKVSRNQSFSGTVTLNTLADALDPANPLNPAVGTLTTPNSNPDPAKDPDAVSYVNNPVTPSLGSGTNVSMQNMVTAAATPGIYTLWIEGQAGSPYLTTKWEPFPLQIGTVTRDFTFTADQQSRTAANVGDSVTFTLTLQNAPDKNTTFGNDVNLSVDAPYPAGTGPVSFGSTSVAPSKNGTSTTVTINSGTMAPGTHRFVVRATAMNGDSPARTVTHLIPLTVLVAPTAGTGTQEYVDIVGYAVMRIVTMDTNSVTAYAISPLITDIHDYRLRRGQVARLAPWN